MEEIEVRELIPLPPLKLLNLDSASVTAVGKEKGFLVENLGDLGLSMRTNELSVNFMKRGSAVVVGSKDESDAISLYKSLYYLKIRL